MGLNNFLSFTFGHVYSLENYLEAIFSPLAEGIAAAPFPEFSAELVQDFFFFCFEVVFTRGFFDSGESFLPQGLVYHIYGSVDKGLLTLDKGGPLLENILLFGHIVAVFHLRNYHLD